MTFLLDALDPHSNGHGNGHANGHASDPTSDARPVTRLSDSRRGNSRLAPRLHPAEVAARRPEPSAAVSSGIVPSDSTGLEAKTAIADLPTLLRICPAEVRQFFASRLTRRSAPAGTVLAKIGQSCDQLWFVEEGLLDVQGPTTGSIPGGAAGPILRRGDYYGSHAVDSTATHTVTLTTLCDATIVEISGEALRAACQRFDSARRWIETVMAARPLANLLRRLAESMPGEEEHLLRLAEE